MAKVRVRRQVTEYHQVGPRTVVILYSDTEEPPTSRGFTFQIEGGSSVTIGRRAWWKRWLRRVGAK
jgi:hypothetical protein